MVLERDLQEGEDMPVVRILYGDQATPSWARRVCPDPKGLYLRPDGACESPSVPI